MIGMIMDCLIWFVIDFVSPIKTIKRNNTRLWNTYTARDLNEAGKAFDWLSDLRFTGLEIF